jgi:hypothetical protein
MTLKTVNNHREAYDLRKIIEVFIGISRKEMETLFVSSRVTWKEQALGGGKFFNVGCSNRRYNLHVTMMWLGVDSGAAVVSIRRARA